MTSPYKARLKEFVGLLNMVTIHRADAPPVVGEIKAVDDFGCDVLLADDRNGSERIRMFVAYEDIRGVGQESAEPR